MVHFGGHGFSRSPFEGAAAMTVHGILFVMTGASGVGKDTIRREVLPEYPDIVYSVSATTRKRRQDEVEGRDYLFLDKETFEGMIERGQFLEYAEYVGDYYGTPADHVAQALHSRHDVLLELELVGARQVKKAIPGAVMIFVAPPTLSELERRLRGRGTDTAEKVNKRLERAREEIRSVQEFDYLVVNDILSEAVGEFSAIIRAERLRAGRVTKEELDMFPSENPEEP
jgi:guanylate kinase